MTMTRQHFKLIAEVLADNRPMFGPEDGTLGDDVLSWCRDVIYVPTRYCMNLAATVNVVLYDRMQKRA